MFRVHGLAGKVVRFDMVNPGVGLTNWSTLNPVYTYATDLDDPATYAIDERAAAANQKEERAWNGAALPSTDGQNWNFVPNAWEENVNQFSFVQRFEKDDAVVAMRVPYPPGYNEHFFQSLASNPLAKVVEIGRSAQNRSLLLAEIGERGDAADPQKPCILIYAGEHADEPDASWIAHGAIDYIASSDLRAEDLRKRFNFLVIPTLDPDAATAAQHASIIYTFSTRSSSRESRAYAEWFHEWVLQGNRLDLVLDMHNVQSSEGEMLACALLERLEDRGSCAEAVHGFILRGCAQSGITCVSRPWAQGWSPSRLGGWLAAHLGPITLAYEANSQSPSRHLSLSETGAVGSCLVESACAALGSPAGTRLLDSVGAFRAKRTDGWQRYGRGLRTDLGAIETEAFVSTRMRIFGDPLTVFAEHMVP
jgi:hypothetical protein